MIEEVVVLRVSEFPNATGRFAELGDLPARGWGSEEERPKISLEREFVDSAGYAELKREAFVAHDMSIGLIEPYGEADEPPDVPTSLIEPGADTVRDEETGWGIEAVRASETAYTGAGVVVAVLDTGIDQGHAAFDGVNWIVTKDYSDSGPGDRRGHGTHCAGTIFGRPVDGRRIGVAPGVPCAMDIKVLPDVGHGNSKALFRGMMCALERGADIIAMSLGFDFPATVEDDVNNKGLPVGVATARALQRYAANLRMFDTLIALNRRGGFPAKSFIVGAAGNGSQRTENPDYVVGPLLPAAAEGVVSVGAAMRDGRYLGIWPRSNAPPVVTAPGVNIVSAKAGGGLIAKTGTSMACPHVAGVAALFAERIKASGIAVDRDDYLRILVIASARPDLFRAGLNQGDYGYGLVTAP